jgi:ribosomal protein L32
MTDPVYDPAADAMRREIWKEKYSRDELPTKECKRCHKLFYEYQLHHGICEYCESEIGKENE